MGQELERLCSHLPSSEHFEVEANPAPVLEHLVSKGLVGWSGMGWRGRAVSKLIQSSTCRPWLLWLAWFLHSCESQKRAENGWHPDCPLHPGFVLSGQICSSNGILFALPKEKDTVNIRPKHPKDITSIYLSVWAVSIFQTVFSPMKEKILMGRKDSFVKKEINGSGFVLLDLWLRK